MSYLVLCFRQRFRTGGNGLCQWNQTAGVHVHWFHVMLWKHGGTWEVQQLTILNKQNGLEGGVKWQWTNIGIAYQFPLRWTPFCAFQEGHEAAIFIFNGGDHREEETRAWMITGAWHATDIGISQPCGKWLIQVIAHLRSLTLSFPETIYLRRLCIIRAGLESENLWSSGWVVPCIHCTFLSHVEGSGPHFSHRSYLLSTLS